MEDGNSTMMRIAVTYVGYGFWNYDDVVYVTYEGTCDYVEEDVITVYGILTGEYSYTFQAGWDITIPSMEAKYF